MAGPWKRYTGETYRRLRYLAAWPPGAQLEVGDICLLQDRAPERQSSITDLDLPLEVVTGKEIRNLGFTSGIVVSVVGRAAVAGPVQPGIKGGARLKVAFNRKHAIMMRAQRTREDQIDRIDLLKAEMLRRYSAGDWDPKWIVITHVVHAADLLVLISEGHGAEVELGAEAGVELTPTTMATGDGSLSVLSHSGNLFEQSGANLTPLYHGIRIRDPFLREPRTKRADKRGRALPGGQDVEVVDVTYS
jgi:hypothetical protein